MLSIDANILLYCYSEASPQHAGARQFIEAASAHDEVALSEFVYNYRDNENGLTRQVVRGPSALDAYWIVPVLVEHRERLGMRVDEDLLDTVLTQFGELLWLRLAGQEPQVVRSAFAAACKTVNALRDRVGPTSNKRPAAHLDLAFRERRYDLWKHACKYGLQ